MKSKKHLILLIIFLSSFRVFARLEAENLKDIDLLKLEFQYLSPTKGYVWSQSGALENFAEIPLEPELLDLQKFILYFFYRANSDDFSVSGSETGISLYLNPEKIGQLLGFFAMQKNQDFKGFDNKINVDQLSKADKKLYYKAKNDKEKETFWRRYLIKKEIINNKLVNSIEDLFFKHKEDNKFYAVLLSLLWEKSISRQNILDYYKGLQSYLGESVFSEKGLTVIKNSSLPEEGGGGGSKETTEDRGVQEAWLSSKFIPSDIETKPEASDLEGSLYWIFVNSRTKNSIPLETGELAYPYGPNGFPDCGEMTLKNFIKLILDKSKRVVEGSAEGDYDTRILDSLNAHSDVKEFFKKFNTRELQKTQEARNEWGRITCKRDGVRYFWSETGVRNPNIEGNICEINAGRINMLTLLNRLFQTPPSLYSQVSELFGLKMKDFIWEEFFGKIKEARQKVWGEVEGDFSVSKWEGDKRYGVEQIGKYRLKTSHFSEILWEFQPGHFHMAEMASARLKDFSDWKSTNALDIYALYPTDSKKIGRVINSLSKNSDAKYFLKLSGDMIPQFFKIFTQQSNISINKEKLLYLFKIFNNLTTERGRASNNEDLKRRIRENLFYEYRLADESLNYESLKDLYDDQIISRDVFTNLLRSSHYQPKNFEQVLLEIINKRDLELFRFVLSVRRPYHSDFLQDVALPLALEEKIFELVKVLFEGADKTWLVNGATRVLTHHQEINKDSSYIFEFVLEKIKEENAYPEFFTNIVEKDLFDSAKIILGRIEDVQSVFSDLNMNYNLISKTIEKGDIELLAIMLEKGFDPNSPRGKRPLPLELAFRKNNIEIGRLLLKNKANSNIEITRFYREKSLLSIVIEDNKKEWIDLLIEHKASGKDINFVEIIFENPDRFDKFKDLIVGPNILNQLNDFSRNKVILSHEKIKILFSIFKEIEKKSAKDSLPRVRYYLFRDVVRSEVFFTYKYFKETLYKDPDLHELAKIILLTARENEGKIFHNLLMKMIEVENFELLSLVPNIEGYHEGGDLLRNAFKKESIEMGRFLLERKASSSNDRRALLPLAIKEGKLDWINLLLDYKTSTSYINLFSVASMPNGLFIIEALVKKGGKNVDELSFIPTNSHGRESLLLLATKNQEIEKIKKYLELGANSSREMISGETPLQHAIINGQEEIADEFLKHKESLIINSRKRSPAYYAIEKGHFDILQKILGVSTEEFPGYMPSDITYAASQGSVESLELFYKFKKLNGGDNDLLFRAIDGNHKEALLKLLEFGFDVNGRNSYYSQTPFEYSVRHEKYEFAEILSANIGEEFRFKSNSVLSLALGQRVPENLFNRILERTENLDELFSDYSAMTPLIKVIKNRRVDLVRKLLLRNANPNIQDSKGKSALIHAVDENQDEIVEILLPYKADPTLCDQNGMSALHYAAMKSDRKILDVLLAGDVSPDVYKEKGVTPLFLAAKEGRVESIKALIAKDADVNFLSALGETSLIVAIKGNHKEAVEILLSEEVDINLKTNIPPLVIAIKNENIEMIDLLLSHNIDVDIGSSQGEFPLLEILLSSGSWAKEVSKKIAERANNINILSADGFFPLTLSENRRFEETSQILKEKEAFHNSHFVEDGSSLVKKLKAKDPSLLDKLFQKKINFAFVERDLFTLVLFYFIDTKEEEILQRFIQEIKEADLNFKYKGETLLMRAAKKGRFKIVQALLEARVDIGVVDSDGECAAQIALENNKFGVFKELLKAHKLEPNQDMYEMLKAQYDKVKEEEEDHSEEPSPEEDAFFEDDSEDDWESPDRGDNFEPDNDAGLEP